MKNKLKRDEIFDTIFEEQTKKYGPLKEKFYHESNATEYTEVMHGRTVIQVCNSGIIKYEYYGDSDKVFYKHMFINDSGDACYIMDDQGKLYMEIIESQSGVYSRYVKYPSNQHGSIIIYETSYSKVLRKNVIVSRYLLDHIGGSFYRFQKYYDTYLSYPSVMIFNKAINFKPIHKIVHAKGLVKDAYNDICETIKNSGTKSISILF